MKKLAALLLLSTLCVAAIFAFGRSDFDESDFSVRITLHQHEGKGDKELFYGSAADCSAIVHKLQTMRKSSVRKVIKGVVSEGEYEIRFENGGRILKSYAVWNEWDCYEETSERFYKTDVYSDLYALYQKNVESLGETEK